MKMARPERAAKRRDERRSLFDSQRGTEKGGAVHRPGSLNPKKGKASNRRQTGRKR